ncbi:hypothetical protein ACHAW5_002453 [Stephanodiscus triporus]|uniref:Protein HGH1 homolog n=1 Tax=Stephanodiscus triporus TaxID=2934178 RepID=A0ABD3NML1_9STRA
MLHMSSDGGERLLRALSFVIGRNLPETYLCLICLLNLTYCRENARVVAYHVPSTMTTTTTSSSLTPPHRWSRSDAAVRLGNEEDDNARIIPSSSSRVLSDPSSLMRSIERVMTTNAVHAFGVVRSVQGEAMRWSCGLIQNLTRAKSRSGGGRGRGGGVDEDGTPSSSPSSNDDNDADAAEEVCSLISRTDIPDIVVRLIDSSPRPTVEWTRDSLEDACLGAMCNMAVWRESLGALKRADAARCLRRLEGLPGIHGYRARAIRCSLGASSPLRFDRAVSSPL